MSLNKFLKNRKFCLLTVADIAKSLRMSEYGVRQLYKDEKEHFVEVLENLEEAYEMKADEFLKEYFHSIGFYLQIEDICCIIGKNEIELYYDHLNNSSLFEVEAKEAFEKWKSITVFNTADDLFEDRYNAA